VRFTEVAAADPRSVRLTIDHRKNLWTCNMLIKKEVRMPKTFTCRDVGVDCEWKARGSDQEDVMRKIREHARTVHKMDPIPADLERKVRTAIRDER
jgi:predicted small metal-binding protein